LTRYNIKCFSKVKTIQKEHISTVLLNDLLKVPEYIFWIEQIFDCAGLSVRISLHFIIVTQRKNRMNHPQWLMMLLLFTVASPIYGEDTTELYKKVGITDSVLQCKQPSKLSKYNLQMVRIDAGLAHWTADRFRTAVFGKDFGFGIGIYPGLSFLQLQARYSFSKIRTVDGDSINSSLNNKHIGFTNVGIALCNHFRRNVNQISLSFFVGAAIISIADRQTITGISNGFGIDYLIRHNKWKHTGMGISLNVQSQTYNITGKKASTSEWFSTNKNTLDRDFNVVFGYVISFTKKDCESTK
jgi:hypothetical protein